MGNAYTERAQQANRHKKVQTLMHYGKKGNLQEEHTLRKTGKATGYICLAGAPTIGCGYTGKINGKTITARTKITQQQANDLLQTDLVRFANHVMKFNHKYKRTQNEFDAMVSFAYNVDSINQLTQNGQANKMELYSIPLK